MAEATANEHPLEPIFHPRSIAIVGVSRDGPGRRRSGFLQSLMEHGYHESKPLYPVNPNADTIAGLRAYPSIRDIEGPVDHVISSVPASVAPSLVDDAIAKGVRSIHFYTAGFAEIGDPELARQQRDIIGRATAAGIRVLGPNCMGLYVPSERISFQGEFPTEPGNVMVISQSGGNSMDIVHGLAKRGVRFSRAVSFGNGEDIDAADLFDYAADDASSEYVVAYLESSARGRQMFEALQRCARVKPTIVLKGGITDDGARAANSHTGSLAGSIDVFDAVCRQAGAMRVRTLEDLLDLAVAMTTDMRHLLGNKVTLVGAGGGFAVLSTDQMAMEGLTVPWLPEATQEQLREIIPIAGTSIRNPVDANFGRDHPMNFGSDTGLTRRVFQSIAAAHSTDLVLTTVGTQWYPGQDRSNEARQQQLSMTAEELSLISREHQVPMALILREARLEDAGDFVHDHGVASFPSIERAARAAASILEWKRRREGLPDFFAYN